MRAEKLKFDERGVFEVINKVFLPWFNSYRFFVENAERYENVRSVAPRVSDFSLSTKFIPPYLTTCARWWQKFY